MNKPPPTHIALPLALASQVRNILGKLPADDVLDILHQWTQCRAVTLTDATAPQQGSGKPSSTTPADPPKQGPAIVETPEGAAPG